MSVLEESWAPGYSVARRPGLVGLQLYKVALFMHLLSRIARLCSHRKKVYLPGHVRLCICTILLGLCSWIYAIAIDYACS